MKKWFSIVIILFTLIFIVSCSSSKATVENFEKVKAGMSEDDVLDLVGSPDDEKEDIVKDWIYNTERKDQNITISFYDGKVDNIDIPYFLNKKKESQSEDKTTPIDKTTSSTTNSTKNKETSDSTKPTINETELENSLDQLINENIESIREISKFDDSWDHVKVSVTDSVKNMSKLEKQDLVDNISSDIRSRLMGFGSGDASDTFFTFSYSDNSTMAESTIFDVYKIKVK
ncbi:hypothetical protein [Enterococcus wangshanyuanii]|uniref:Lipoprotein SmpA/OmlA domain-containing protein n=1 Tax=Enterococcus wangshanyuanii TaxID=2005703 RepID=A0ABQ1PS50_9ENTE|nr:hypothetical protein [Enterococcus wangshanyuanii]GGD02405.1 hypothetical protein GCM10011573_34800 [Enterococcus wangshanyuanii]